MKPSSQPVGPAKLFIRTRRAPVVRYENPNVPGHYCQAGYRTVSTMISLSPEEDRAKKALARSGVKFEIVDLSERGEKKFLTGWFRGVKQTPTLLIDGHPRRRIEGVEAISDYVSSLKKTAKDSAVEEEVTT
jgi:glutaredoxin